MEAHMSAPRFAAHAPSFCLSVMVHTIMAVVVLIYLLIPIVMGAGVMFVGVIGFAHVVQTSGFGVGHIVGSLLAVGFILLGAFLTKYGLKGAAAEFFG